MTEREAKLREHIAGCHERARQHLGASDADVQRGLELHRELLVCDSFTLPWSIPSSAGIARINAAIEEGWDASEVAQLRLNVNLADVVYDEECAHLHDVIFEASGGQRHGHQRRLWAGHRLHPPLRRALSAGLRRPARPLGQGHPCAAGARGLRRGPPRYDLLGQ